MLPDSARSDTRISSSIRSAFTTGTGTSSTWVRNVPCSRVVATISFRLTWASSCSMPRPAATRPIAALTR